MIRTVCAIWCAVACAACATGGGGPLPGAGASPTSFAAPDSEQAAPAPPPAERYDTAARPGGVLGGPEAVRIAEAVSEALRKRGDRAEPDGALAAAGRRLARDAQEGRKVELIEASNTDQ